MERTIRSGWLGQHMVQYLAELLREGQEAAVVAGELDQGWLGDFGALDDQVSVGWAHAAEAARVWSAPVSETNSLIPISRRASRSYRG